MRLMQRLQPWLMPGMACFTLSVGLIGLQVNLERNKPSSEVISFVSLWNLPQCAYWLLILGSRLILSGCLIHCVILPMRWLLGKQGRFYRRLKRKIKEANVLIAKEPQEFSSSTRGA